jgi:hypothetical protein
MGTVAGISGSLGFFDWVGMSSAVPDSGSVT